MNRYGYVWDNHNGIYRTVMICSFKRKLMDCFIQEWDASIRGNRVLTLYKTVKDTFQYELYLCDKRQIFVSCINKTTCVFPQAHDICMLNF